MSQSLLSSPGDAPGPLRVAPPRDDAAPPGDRELRDWVDERWLLTASPRVRAAAATLTPQQRLLVGLGMFTGHRSGRIAQVAGLTPRVALGELRTALVDLGTAMNAPVPAGR